MNRFPDPQRSKVVLIGTSDYEYRNKLSPLPSIRNNLVGLEDAFTNSSTGVFVSENCTVADSPDSPKTMMQRLNRAAREAEDVFVAYYAGHGLLGWGSKLYLSVRETDPEQLGGTAVPFEWVRDSLRESSADIRILILDCCFSGRAIGAMSSDSAALEQIKIAGTTILTSTTANDISHSIPGERYTAFTGELITLLTRPSDGVLTLHDLYRPLSAAMARRGLPSPKNSIGDSSGDIILRRPTMPMPQYAPSNIVAGNQTSWPYQAPHGPTPPPPPQHQSANLGPVITPNQTVAEWHTPPYSPQPASVNTEPSNPASQTIPLLKRSAPITGLIALIFSTILAGGVLAAGIAQSFGDQAFNDGVPAYIFTIVFVSAWLIVSIFLLIKLIKSHFLRNRKGGAFQKSRDRLRVRVGRSHG
jgi:Caspase domain